MLTAKKVEKLKIPGRYRDGLIPGLYLQVAEGGAKSWLLRYEVAGREHMLGLGSARTFTLKAARERARAARVQLADGIDPLVAKRAARATAAAEAAKAISFREVAEKYFDQHAAKWSNRKHRDQFLASLRDYAFPLIGALPVAALDTALVLKVLEQPVAASRGNPAGAFWSVRPETASRVRSRIENVLDYATVRGHRQGDNPARWKGYLDQVLPTARRVKNLAALSYAELPAFMTTLAAVPGVPARALEFLILTAARAGEVVGARWSEIDLGAAIWTIPAERMKARREHRVPLSPRALDLLKGLYREDGNPFVFIGGRGGLAETAMFHLLRRLGRGDITIHGFRSTFRVWAAERTSYPREVAEQSLAHSVGSAVERTYARTTLFDHRRRLMAEWSAYCYGPPVEGAVVPLRGTR